MPKRNKYIEILLAVSLIVIVLSGCSTQAQKASPVEDFIKLSYENGSQIRKGEFLTVWIKNTSEDCIIFPHDFGIKIYYEKDGKTHEVKNKWEYLPVYNKVLDPVGSMFSEHEVFINPDVSSIKIKGQIDFQATIAGYTCKDNNIVVEKQIPFSIIP